MSQQSLTLLRETASQTAGPYVHIGLSPQQAGFDIFENNFGNVLVTPQDARSPSIPQALRQAQDARSPSIPQALRQAQDERSPSIPQALRQAQDERSPSIPQGERIRVEGTVTDGSGTLVRDVLIEIWQANAQGKYNHPADRQPGKSADPAFRGWGRACSDFETGLYTFETIKPGSVLGRNGRPMAPHINFWIVARGINLGLNTRMYFSDEAQANAVDPVINLIEWEVRRKTLVAQREQREGKVVYRFDIRLQGEGETVFFDI